jgi:HEAT repeat protein
MKLQFLLIGLVISSACVSGAGEPAARAVVYSPHAANFECHMNLGPTGAAVWMRGYQFVVMRIDQGSPAHTRLLPADVILAADGVTFGPAADPRITLGQAIERAEATGQPLTLTVWRHGAKQEVAIELPRLGAFAPTWPADCEKSARILDAACRSLLNAQLPTGQVTTDGNLGTYQTGLLLLASGNPQYLDGARRAAYQAAAMDYEKVDMKSWPLGYGGLLLAEYYLATGDPTVLEKLQWIATALARGQMKCGSWGHDSPGGGYGALNQAGVVCAIALQLAAECGVTVDRDALDKAHTFFSRYAELGCVPYGDHLPGSAMDDNGKNSSAAVLARLAGNTAAAQTFSRSVALSYWMREQGHTGPYFSLLWGPLAAAQARPEEFRAFMDYLRWYYNLCRTWKGELVLLPYHEALTRFDDSGYIYFGGDFTTGGLALVFALPQRRLRILGAPASVFGAPAKLTGDLAAARASYLRRDWTACDQLLAVLDPKKFSSDEERRWLAQLRDARTFGRAAVEQTLLEIESNLVEGDAYRAAEQLAALKRAFGLADDQRIQALEKRFTDSTVAWHVREGQQYYTAWQQWNAFAIKSWVPAGPQAKRRQEGVPVLRPRLWEPLAPTSEITPQPWRSQLFGAAETLPVGWEQVDFDDQSWTNHAGIFTAFDAQNPQAYPQGTIAARRRFPVHDTNGASLRIRLQTVRPARTRVYLNGVLVAEAVRGQRGGYAAIELDRSVLELLRRGENVLAVTCNQQGKDNNRLDVGLEINRVNIEQRALPPIRATHIYTTDLPGDDNALYVQDTTRKFEKSLQEKFEQKSIAALVADLAEPVPYLRHLAENALVNKGQPGVAAAAALSNSPDWKTRSAFCNIVIKSLAPAVTGVDRAFLEAQVPALTRLLADDHFWVRHRAARALEQLGPAAASAAPVLLPLLHDPHEWVRTAALSAIRDLPVEPAVLVKAAQESLRMPNTAYAAPQLAVKIFQQNPEPDRARLAALIHLLQNPPEGDGHGLLNEVITLAATLDPSGATLIPVLLDAAADKTGLSRQRGNPRGKAIEQLGRYGPQARAAVPILEAILASDDKREKALHESTRTALVAIRGELAP